MTRVRDAVLLDLAVIVVLAAHQYVVLACRAVQASRSMRALSENLPAFPPA